MQIQYRFLPRAEMIACRKAAICAVRHHRHSEDKEKQACSIVPVIKALPDRYRIVLQVKLQPFVEIHRTVKLRKPFLQLLRVRRSALREVRYRRGQEQSKSQTDCPQSATSPSGLRGTH